LAGISRFNFHGSKKVILKTNWKESTFPTPPIVAQKKFAESASRILPSIVNQFYNAVHRAVVSRLDRQRGFIVTIEFRCHGCSSVLRVPDEHLGKQARCPKCQTLNLIEPISWANDDGVSLGSKEDDDWRFRPDPFSDRKSSPKPFSHELPSDDWFSQPSETRENQRTPYQSNPYQAPVTPASSFRGPHQVSHRGGLILGLGIFSICCNLCLLPGILAWAFGNSDLQQMENGIMDRSGEGLTRTGMILGIVMTLVSAAYYLVKIFAVLFAR